MSQQILFWQIQQTQSHQILQYPKCTIGLNKQKCISLGYIVYGQKQPQIDYVLNYLKKQNDLDDTDLKQFHIQPSQINQFFSQQRNRNITQALILFCTDNKTLNYKNISIPCSGQQFHTNFYVLYMNITLFHKNPFFSDLKAPQFKDQANLKLKNDIDEALIKYYYEKKYGQIESLDYSIQLSSFPAKSSRFVAGLSIMGNSGPFFLLIPYLILLVMQSSRLLKQKQNRIRIGLNIVGVSHFQFYFAQIMFYLFSVIMISISFCFFGYLFGFQFFTKALLWYDFLVLTANGFIIGLIAFCVTAAVNQKNLGMSLIYGFVLYSVIMANILYGGIIINFLYFWNTSLIVLVFRYIFNLYPAYHFTKIFLDVQRKAGSSFNVQYNSYITGKGFIWDDLFSQQTFQFQFPERNGITIPSPLQTTINLFLTSIILYVALYLLDILVQSNRGYKESLFCKFKKARKQSDVQNQQNYLVMVNNLQKIYNNKVFALRGVNFNITQGQIVSLLGQNGAGKSTLINILIGALSQTSGKIVINGSNVSQNITQIRKILGVCPQFDILWQDISAYQHMYIFSKLKGIENYQQSIRQGLQKVNLWKNKDGKVSTFSGGMKRRLSLAISLIGKPKLVVLDEPTTGMDVKIRLQTWKIILSMRGQTTILITTHNMQQSECLSDRILIMNKGRLIASGTSLSLKKQFGAGYVIKGINPESKQEEIIKCKQEDLQKQLQGIEQRGLQNWSLRQTTLQEVFLNAIKKF